MLPCRIYWVQIPFYFSEGCKPLRLQLPARINMTIWKWTNMEVVWMQWLQCLHTLDMIWKMQWFWINPQLNEDLLTVQFTRQRVFFFPMVGCESRRQIYTSWDCSWCMMLLLLAWSSFYPLVLGSEMMWVRWWRIFGLLKLHETAN